MDTLELRCAPIEKHAQSVQTACRESIERFKRFAQFKSFNERCVSPGPALDLTEEIVVSRADQQPTTDRTV
jgi:hypothetical protein